MMSQNKAFLSDASLGVSSPSYGGEGVAPGLQSSSENRLGNGRTREEVVIGVSGPHGRGAFWACSEGREKRAHDEGGVENERGCQAARGETGSHCRRELRRGLRARCGGARLKWL